MRFTHLLASLASLGLATTGCLGTTGDGRSNNRGADQAGTTDGSGDATGSGAQCAELDQDLNVTSTADMAGLPKTGCFDLYGKLTISGPAITSLAGLGGLNSVNELVLDNTGLTTLDTKGDVGIYGKLTVTGNPKLTNLKKLAFGNAPVQVLIDNNAQLASLDAFAVGDPQLAQVTGDLTITNNPRLAAIKAPYLTSVTGAVTIANNTALTSLDLSPLTGAGSLAITSNPALGSLATMTSLYRVAGNLTINGNAALSNLGAFTTSLKYVDAMLNVSNNGALADLGALKHLALVGAITITGNASLLACRATEVDRCTSHPISSVIGNNKSSSCSWQCN
ncbi:MAG TPA: hypothetical protein VFP84_31115 [Kofleriaceae bacterium]|nr:hypothetical protein [Kofleriaceae bacterium]